MPLSLGVEGDDQDLVVLADGQVPQGVLAFSRSFQLHLRVGLEGRGKVGDLAVLDDVAAGGGVAVKAGLGQRVPLNPDIRPRNWRYLKVQSHYSFPGFNFTGNRIFMKSKDHSVNCVT